VNNRILGKEGENIATGYLVKKGYQILQRNYQKRSGEIDIIALDFDEICFIEVKTRKSGTYGYPEEAIDERKLAKISETAETWLEENEKTDSLWRIDAISVVFESKNPSIIHLKNISIEFDD